MEIAQLLEIMVDKQASDLFISVDAPPIIKIEGKSHAVGKEVITPELAQQLIYSILKDDQIKEFEKTLEMNMALSVDKLGRFRVNVFRQRGEPALVARFVKSEIPSIEQLGLPVSLKDLIMEQRGLVLMVGGTGTGKSTSLASMIDYRNEHQAGHILTIEDPVEFIHSHKKSLLNQREVGFDTLSYENALKNALREAPDVIMIGEIRDVDTMKHALAYAETGHLCISTLHANNANQAIDRIINFFPEAAHRQLLMDLSLHLRAVVSQRLAKGLQGKRVAAVEVMINTPYISELIKKGKFDVIKDAMQQTSGRIGQTFDDAIYALFKQGQIDEQEALRQADSKNNMSLKIRLEKNSPHDQAETENVVTNDSRVNFSTYDSFKVTPLKVDKTRRKDMEEVISKGLVYCFQQKGLKYDKEQPVLDVQFIVGIKSKENLSLIPMDNEVDPFADIKEDTETHATLVINIVDTRTKKPVWRVSKSRKITGPIRLQTEINDELCKVVADFPLA